MLDGNSNNLSLLTSSFALFSILFSEQTSVVVDMLREELLENVYCQWHFEAAGRFVGPRRAAIDFVHR